MNMWVVYVPSLISFFFSFYSNRHLDILDRDSQNVDFWSGSASSGCQMVEQRHQSFDSQER